MYLYDKTQKYFYIYEFIPNKEKIKQFKIQEMSKIDDTEKILRVETNNTTNSILNDSVKDVFMYNEINYFKDNKALGTIYHKLENSNLDTKTINKILEMYYNENFNDYMIKTIKNINKKTGKCYDEQYILTSGKYSYISNQIREITNIINITKDLYLFHLLNNGEFEKLNNENITKQINLFELNENPVEKFSIDSIKKIDNNITKVIPNVNETYYDILDKNVDKSSKILKLVK